MARRSPRASLRFSELLRPDVGYATLKTLLRALRDAHPHYPHRFSRPSGFTQVCSLSPSQGVFERALEEEDFGGVGDAGKETPDVFVMDCFADSQGVGEGIEQNLPEENALEAEKQVDIEDGDLPGVNVKCSADAVSRSAGLYAEKVTAEGAPVAATRKETPMKVSQQHQNKPKQAQEKESALTQMPAPQLEGAPAKAVRKSRARKRVPPKEDTLDADKENETPNQPSLTRSTQSTQSSKRVRLTTPREQRRARAMAARAGLRINNLLREVIRRSSECVRWRDFRKALADLDPEFEDFCKWLDGMFGRDDLLVLCARKKACVFYSDAFWEEAWGEFCVGRGESVEWE